MRKHEPLDVTAAVARLAGQVDRIERDLTATARQTATVRGDVDAHSRTLADLADLIRRNRTAPSASSGMGSAPGGQEEMEPPPAPEWLTVTDPDLAVAWLSGLAAWITDVWTQYQALPGCWAWHPTAVAELLICQHVWLVATMPGISPEALAAWHDRWRPGTARRVENTLAACERAHGFHTTRGGQEWAYDPTVIDELAVWWATTHGATPPPGLTREDHR